MFKIQENSFYIENEKEYLICAEIHYFRIECKNWRKVLEKAIELGCNSIAFYIPWFVHEYKEGVFDFTGVNNPKYNLVAFLELLKEYKLKIILRPGPYIYAEMTNLGLPNWLVENYANDRIEEYKNGVLVKSEFSFAFAHNNPIFKEKTKRYIEKVIDICKPYLDNVIMVQLCNEIPGLDTDDHSNYRMEYLKNFISKKFTIDEFNDIFESNFKDFTDINVKEIYKHKNYKHLHLEEQYTTYFYDYFMFLKSIYIDKGVNKIFIHNAYNPKALSLFSKIKEKMPELLIGTDNYYSLFGNLNDKSIAYFCEFGVSYTKNILNNIPYVLEQESGFWHDTPKVFGEELFIFNFWSLLYGYKGLNMYLFHEGVNEKGMGFNGINHNWQALVDLNGDETEKFSFVKNAIYEARVNSSVMEEVEYDCAMSFEHFPGLIWDSLSKKTEDFYYFLFKANHQPEIIDILKTSLDVLKKYKVIYFLVDERLSEELQLRIIELINLKLPIVLVGNLPTHTWYKENTTLVDYLNIEIIKEERDGFSQKLLLENDEIIYSCKNLSNIKSNYNVDGKTNYDVPIILSKDNTIILNGFPVFQMMDQIKIIKHIDQYFNFEHKNYKCDLRIVKKVDGSIFVLNPFPFKIKEDIFIMDKKINIEVDGFNYKYFKNQKDML